MAIIPCTHQSIFSIISIPGRCVNAIYWTQYEFVDSSQLRVKGSGSDLKTIEPKHFSGVRMDDVLLLQARDDMSDEEILRQSCGGAVGAYPGRRKRRLRHSLQHAESDAIFEAGLWTPELKAERARAQGIPVEQLEEHYRQRNLLKASVTAEDVAQAALFFASDRSAKTTSAALPIDGGLREAFPR